MQHDANTLGNAPVRASSQARWRALIHSPLALPLAGLTAWQALVDHAHVQPGERVLVHGGGGGVGAFTVQLAVALGADVATTVRSDEARGIASGFGARVIDTRTERLWLHPERYVIAEVRPGLIADLDGQDAVDAVTARRGGGPVARVHDDGVPQPDRQDARGRVA